MSLSLLVIIHEGGHFLFARLFKVRVEKFCLFFDPWFTLFKFKPKKSDTEYAVGWLPLGGYVKISGMIDESMDTEQMKQPEKPWEFRSKPAWQRLLIMVGGVLFNFLLALFIYSMILFTWGDQYIKIQEAPLGMQFNETAKAVGFVDGDVLLSADGVEFLRYDADLLSQIADAREVSVLRGGQKVSVYIPEDMMQRLMADSVRFADYRVPYVVDSLSVNSQAALAGLMPGDSVIALNGAPISYYEFLEEMGKRRKNAAALEKARRDSREPRAAVVLRLAHPELVAAVAPGRKVDLGVQKFCEQQDDLALAVFQKNGVVAAIADVAADGVGIAPAFCAWLEETQSLASRPMGSPFHCRKPPFQTASSVPSGAMVRLGI